MQRNTRKQTAEEKRKADMEMWRNGATALRTYIKNNPRDRFNPDRERQATMLESKLAQVAA